MVDPPEHPDSPRSGRGSARADKPERQGGELFIVDNSDEQWKAARYLHDWCDIAPTLDVATAYFQIGALLALDGQLKDRRGRILSDEDIEHYQRDHPHHG